jgi:hypothetical protein
MADLHPVEAAWRRIRRTGDDLLQRCLTMRQPYLDSIGLKRCPAEVVLPTGAIWNVEPLLGLRSPMEQHDDFDFDWSAAELLARSVHFWAAYRESKIIYEVEPALAECLACSVWPESTPAAALRLPSRCPVLSIQRGDITVHVAAAYDLLSTDEKPDPLKLCIAELKGEGWRPILGLEM